MSEDKLPLILVYHALSVGLIIAGNKLCCKKTFRLGLFASLFMSLMAVVTMLSFYHDALVFVDPAQFSYVIAAFLVQFVGAAALSVALMRSTTCIKEKGSRLVLQLLNIMLFFAVLLVATYLFPQTLAMLIYPSKALIGPSYAALLIATISVTVFSAAYLFGMLAFRQKLNMDSSLERIVVITSCIVIALLAFGFYVFVALQYPSSLRVTGLMLIAFILVACQRITKNKTYLWIANIVLAADFTLMALGGYKILVTVGTVVSGLIYLALFMGSLAYLWSQVDEAEKPSLLIPFKILMLVVAEISVLVIFAAGYTEFVFAFLIIVLGFLVLFKFRFDARNVRQEGFWTFIRVHELVLVLASCGVIAFEDKAEITQILSAVLALACIALLVCSTYRISRTSQTKGWLGIPVGIVFTLVLMATIGGLSTWFDEPYVLSLVLMASALLCIIGGFVGRIKSLRLYGLIIIIACVLKLATLDIGNAETIMRVVAFIVGGLICFGISALYTYTVKRFDVTRVLQR